MKENDQYRECQDCRFFDRLDGDYNFKDGICKRYPPIVVTVDLFMSPRVYESDYCGEWKGKGEK
jgi:hypothetical protein